LPWAQRPGRWLAGRDGAPCRRGTVENDSHYQAGVIENDSHYQASSTFVLQLVHLYYSTFVLQYICTLVHLYQRICVLPP